MKMKIKFLKRIAKQMEMAFKGFRLNENDVWPTLEELNELIREAEIVSGRGGQLSTRTT